MKGVDKLNPLLYNRDKIKGKTTERKSKKMRYVLKDKKVKYWTVEQILAYKSGASVEEVDKMVDDEEEE